MATLYSSKLQFFEPPVKMARKSLCVVTCHNTICAEFCREADQSFFGYFFLEKSNISAKTIFPYKSQFVTDAHSAPLRVCNILFIKS